MTVAWRRLRRWLSRSHDPINHASHHTTTPIFKGSQEPGHIPDYSAWYVTHRDRYHLDMPLRVVQRVLHTWDEIGAVVRELQKLGRARLMTTDQISVSTSYFSICVS